MMSPKARRNLQSGGNKNKFTMKRPQVEDIEEQKTVLHVLHTSICKVR